MKIFRGDSRRPE